MGPIMTPGTQGHTWDLIMVITVPTTMSSSEADITADTISTAIPSVMADTTGVDSMGALSTEPVFAVAAFTAAVDIGAATDARRQLLDLFVVAKLLPGLISFQVDRGQISKVARTIEAIALGREDFLPCRFYLADPRLVVGK